MSKPFAEFEPVIPNGKPVVSKRFLVCMAVTNLVSPDNCTLIERPITIPTEGEVVTDVEIVVHKGRFITRRVTPSSAGAIVYTFG